MKIFWSWQSDTPGKSGRHFVREALLDAIEELKVSVDVEEPTQRSALASAHLDQDRKGVSGSPDLARVILDKIAQSAVFVADVTPVGAVSGHDTTGAKKLMNPNVAIELGYALALLGDGALLMVMNSHYGGRSDLPFDLQAKAGPIIFNLPPGADRATYESVGAQLKGNLKTALRECFFTWQRLQEEAELARVREESASTRITSKDWEQIAAKLGDACRHIRADSVIRKEIVEWRIAGGYGGLCEPLLRQAGAMLLKSPNVLAQMPAPIAAEPDHLRRWLFWLKHCGCHTSENYFIEELADGTKETGMIGGIRDLSANSVRIATECATLEI